MAELAWVQLCEKAFLDNCDRLCLVGIINRLPIPTLPITVHELMLAGRVVNAGVGEELDVSVSIATPSGLCPSPDEPGCLEISNAGEYVLVTLRQFPLYEEGVYRFSLSIGDGAAVAVEIPVLLVGRPAHAPVH
jgi:hypothetical protein